MQRKEKEADKVEQISDGEFICHVDETKMTIIMTQTKGATTSSVSPGMLIVAKDIALALLFSLATGFKLAQP